MWPAASVSGYYFAHPQGSIWAWEKLPHQLKDYSQRRGIPLQEARNGSIQPCILMKIVDHIAQSKGNPVYF